MDLTPKEGFQWPVCPWHDVTADACPSTGDDTVCTTDEQLADHVTWHCLVMVDAGILEEVGSGKLRFKEGS